MIEDKNKGITIWYNYLNLPSKVTFVNGNSISYIYDTNGNKQKMIVTQNVGNSITQNTTDYVNGFVYVNNALNFFANETGRVLKTASGFQTEYVINDHLGNARMTVVSNENNEPEILQYDSYYPFGLEMGGLSYVSSNENKFKYNGKEKQDALGLNYYDYGARFYDPQIGRWNVVDPLASKYPMWSPYNYVLNNPIRLIDPDGRAPDYYETPDGEIVHRNSTASTVKENGQTLKNVGDSYVAFNGTSLDLHYQTKDANGNLQAQTYSTPAVSGRPDENGNFDYSQERQATKNEGPLPEGKYSINPNAVQEMGIGDDLIGKLSGVTSQVTGQKFGAWPGGSDAWGFSRLDISPNSISIGGTERGGFTIHGGTSAGSAGCIDCMSGQRAFFTQLQKYSGGSSSVLLKVDYSGLNKLTASPFK